MQRGRTKRCQVPIRTRRRQSDAKWRASVASCYETLKFVIPNGKVLPKRKASKSLILQETEKHIGNLERAISRLLNIEAQDQGQGVLWRKGDNWSPATLEDMQNDFAIQQREIFHQSSQGRRCYNMLHDIQEEILSLSVDYRHMAFLPLSIGDSNKNTRDVATCTTRRHRISKARCHFETERASQRILSAYNTGDIINAVIPSAATTTTITTFNDTDQLQAVPTTPVTTHASMTTESSTSISNDSIKGTAIRLQKLGNIFVSTDHTSYLRDSGPGSEEMPFQSLSGLERVVVKHQYESEHLQSVQEVPVMMTPHKVYGIARHDVMMSQECEVPELNQGLHHPSMPATNGNMLKRETPGKDRGVPNLSHICKKLDFSESASELLFENSTDMHITGSPSCFSSAVTSANTVFTPLKSVTQTIGLTPVKSTSMTLSGGQSFTPVKTSSEPYMSDAALFSPNSAWTLGNALDARVPQAGLSDLEVLTDIDDDHNLLCMENFDLTDVTVSPLTEKTPQKLPSSDSAQAKHVCKKRAFCTKSHSGRKDCKNRSSSKRPRPKCRKRLDGLFKKSGENSEGMSGVPVNAGLFGGNAECSDFDGYLLYYQQVAPGLKKQLGSSHDANSLAAIVSNMWSQLPCDDRNTMVTLAALENQDSNSSGSGSLSQDLEELNVTPIASKEPGY